ncbi:hypothetical protein [Streptomyces sp. NPDC020917]|uniref:hypothetical protein n=1 Tax=Streptomyces sp. NPDC020917 TaxID=3365102 RepID=UPI0037981985
MRQRRRRGEGWPDPAAAERVLDGRDAESDIARLLAAAARPLEGRPEGEAAALAAFREAHAAKAGRAGTAVRAERAVAGRAGVRRSSGPRSFTVKALLGGAAAALALGGVAIAAQGGDLPRPFHHSHPDTPRPTTPPASPPATSPAPVLPAPTTAPAAPPSTPGHAPTMTHPPKATSPTPSARPRSLKGLCVAYLKQEANAPGGHPLDPADLARLTKQAGGPTHVHAYCQALTAHPTTATPLSLGVTITITP